jgi:hypothetical protein
VVGVRPHESVVVRPHVSVSAWVIMAWFTSGDQGEAVFEAVAGSVDVDHVAVVEEAVEDGDGQDVVAKNLAPFGGAFVAGDDHGAAFLSAGDESEDHVGFGPVQGQVAHFVHDQDRGTQVGLQLSVESACPSESLAGSSAALVRSQRQADCSWTSTRSRRAPTSSVGTES